MSGDTFAIGALTRKRAEVAGEIEAAEERLGQLRANLVHIDAVLMMFDGSAEPSAIRPVRKRGTSGYFANGELPRLLLDALRASGPISTPDLTRGLMAAKGLSADNKALYEVIIKKVWGKLIWLQLRGSVAKERGAGGITTWRVA